MDKDGDEGEDGDGEREREGEEIVALKRVDSITNCPALWPTSLLLWIEAASRRII